MPRTFSETEIFTPNPGINARLRGLIPAFDRDSQRRVVKRLRELRDAAQLNMQSEIRAQIFRMLAELELGARLLHCGRQVEYGRELEGKTPDWIDEADGLLVEVVTAGPTQDMYKHADRGEIWCGFVETETSSLARDRFHDALLSKVTTYQELVVRRSLRYVIAVCGSMETDASPYDGRRVILQERMFNDRNHLSGVIYFNVTPFRSFDYIANPSADRPVNLDGVNLLPENLIADWGGTDQS